MQNTSNTKLAIFALGFRPFFLGAALAGALMIPLWVAAFAGLFAPPTDLAIYLWHAHEMIFGFVAAVIAGFLLTASQNWTGLRGVHGKRLAGCFSIWLAARLLAFVPSQLLLLYSVVDLMFFPVLAALLWPYIGRADQRKHWIFFLFFVMLIAANLLFHLELHGWIRGWFAASNSLAVHTVVAYLTVIGGRVIPFFTTSAIESARIRRFSIVEQWILPTTLVFAGADFLRFCPLAIFAIPTVATALKIIHILSAIVACAGHALRLFGWDSWRTRRKPILWILHLAYFMIVVGFALHVSTGLFAAGLNAHSIALHAFTAGAMGLFIYAMISRVSLGHTGRPIQAAGIVVVGYGLLILAVLVRVVGPIGLFYSGDQMGDFMRLYPSLILASGIAWTCAYVILLVKYAPMLAGPRVDGKPG